MNNTELVELLTRYKLLGQERFVYSRKICWHEGMTVLGTRPEIIRLSRVVEKLDRLCTHVAGAYRAELCPNLSDLTCSANCCAAPLLFFRRSRIIISPVWSSSAKSEGKLQ
jgi:hypothetical protein